MPSAQEITMLLPQPIRIGLDESPATDLALKWAVDDARARELPL